MSTYGDDGHVVATKINGKYWMYWGDAQIWLATSTDLIHWTPIEMAPGETPPVPLRAQALTMPDLKIVLPTRAGMFDSDLVESGPPAMLTDQGIRLIYNSRNVPAIGDKTLPKAPILPPRPCSTRATPPSCSSAWIRTSCAPSAPTKPPAR